eukprot:3201161-Alexandrium_andersonii.AAC.1
MLALAMITKPWCMLMRSLHATPRALADDWMVTAAHEDGVFQSAVQATHTMVESMGGSVSSP